MLAASQVWLLLAATIEPILPFQTCLNAKTHPEEEKKSCQLSRSPQGNRKEHANQLSANMSFLEILSADSMGATESL